MDIKAGDLIEYCIDHDHGFTMHVERVVERDGHLWAGDMRIDLVLEQGLCIEIIK
jgi:hypothetical protein